MGGAHHCVVTEPQESPDESPLIIDGDQPRNSEVLDWFRSNAEKFVYPDERGLHYLLWRLVDNAVDQALGGYATAVKVRILADGGVEVSDDGGGIAASQPDPFLPTTYRIAAAVPRVGDDTASDHRFGDFGGTRAAGVWIVNALSTRMEVESTHEDEHWAQRYANTRPAGFELDEATGTTGTTIRFWVAPDVFARASFDFDTVSQQLAHLALLNNGVTFDVIDERTAAETRSRTYCGTEGLTGYLQRRIVRYRSPIHDDVIHFVGRRRAGDIEIALQWTLGFTPLIRTFVDNIDTSRSPGSHEMGLRAAVTNVINRYVRSRKLLRDTEPDLTDEQVCTGLAAVVSVRPSESAVFEDSACTQLTDTHLEFAVRRLCQHRLTRWFEQNPVAAANITHHLIETADAARSPRRSQCQMV